MEEVNLPKFKWETTFEHNSGHDKNEWGKNENNEKESEIKFIIAYTVKGDLSKMGSSGFLSSHLSDNDSQTDLRKVNRIVFQM